MDDLRVQVGEGVPGCLIHFTEVYLGCLQHDVPKTPNAIRRAGVADPVDPRRHHGGTHSDTDQRHAHLFAPQYDLYQHTIASSASAASWPMVPRSYGHRPR